MPSPISLLLNQTTQVLWYANFFSIIDITKQTNGGQNKRARWSLPFKPIFTSFTRELSLKIHR